MFDNPSPQRIRARSFTPVARGLLVFNITVLACGASSSGPSAGGASTVGEGGQAGAGGSVAAGGGGGASTSACDQPCLDGIALRSVRAMTKVVFNQALQGAPLGGVDATTDCPGGGTAHVYGTASSNAAQGVTMIDVTYDLIGCRYAETDPSATKSFDMSTTGKITEQGALGVQPSAMTTLAFSGTGLTLTGTVYDPPAPYSEPACSMAATQTGNSVSGALCGRPAAFSF